MKQKEIQTKRGSEEWKKKVSKGWFKKGAVSLFKGRHFSTESKEKLSNALKGKKAWNKGIKMSDAQKNLLSKISFGKHYSLKTEFKKGDCAGDKNVSKRPDVRKKISESKKGKPLFNMRGEKHPRWGGPTTSENERIRRRIEYKIWRETIFKKDNWTCQKCKTRGNKLNVHHIFNFADFSELRISAENGITLCKNCHKQFHKQFGYKNNNLNKFRKFLNS